MPVSSTAEVLSFQCGCGAALKAAAAFAGKRGKCKFCGARLTIPGPTSPQLHGVALEAPFLVEKLMGTCGICQCAIGSEETVCTCSACGLPYHEECWDGNYGCAAYGCVNVNLLKPGPDIKLPASVIPSASVPSPKTLALPGEDAGIPWEFVLLAISVPAGLMSCLLFGLPSLLLAAGAGIYFGRVQIVRLEILALIWGIAAISTFVGIWVSLRLYVL